jgi:hypothetical protein
MKSSWCQRAGIFPHQGTLTIQAALPALSDPCILCVHDNMKITTLLFGPPDRGSQRGTFVHYSRQS